MARPANTICIRLPEEILRELNEIAGSLDRTKSYLIRKAIEQYLTEYVDYRIALDRLHDKDDEIISSKELKKRLASGN
jgi:RHH-type rel operon transcriptional repressor/antitoxin RelB